MKRGTIYLAGPIANTDAGDAFEWRGQAAVILHDLGYAVLNPLRGKVELKGQAIGDDCNEFVDKGPFYTPKGILSRDYNDVKRSDIVLANLWGTEYLSAGTAMEFAWTHAFQIPTVVIIEPDGSNPHDKHPMIHAAIGWRNTKLADAIFTLDTIMGGAR